MAQFERFRGDVVGRSVSRFGSTPAVVLSASVDHRRARRSGGRCCACCSNRGLPATVVITMDIDQLEAAAGVATTATGGIVPIWVALALATAAYPVLCLFDTDGQPLHLGRGARLASAAQRLALYARDRGCTRPGPADPP